MKYLILLSILGIIIASSLTFEDAFADRAINPQAPYDKPTLDFIGGEYLQNETITITCVPDSKKTPRNIVWTIVNTDTKTKVLLLKDQSETFSFVADFDVGNYNIKCRTSFGDARTSIVAQFSIVSNITGGILASNNNPISHPDSIPPTKSQELNKNEGNGGCPDCTSPTIGVDTKGKRFVDYGVVLNGEAFQLGNYKTHIPMMYTEIGVENHLTLKVYENGGAYNVDYMQFGIVKEIGSPMNIFEPRLEIDVKNTSNDIYNPGMEGVELWDKEGIIKNHRVDVSLTQCMEGFTHECLQLDIYWTFDKVPENVVLAINGWDNAGNAFNQYLNDGLTVIDTTPIVISNELPHEEECIIYTVAKRTNSCQFQPMIDYEIQRALETLEKIE